MKKNNKAESKVINVICIIGVVFLFIINPLIGIILGVVYLLSSSAEKEKAKKKEEMERMEQLLEDIKRNTSSVNSNSSEEIDN